MYLLVGLGNPGKDYHKNRHNAGFMAIDDISDYHNISVESKKFNSLFGSGNVKGNKVYFLKPMTYMNLSGNAVGECVRYYKIKPENVIVFHDELDLIFGKVKLKYGGGAAGHNGIKSIIQHIGEKFHRIRIGIGKPEKPAASSNVKNFVLGDFSKADSEKLDDIFAIMAKYSHLLLADNKQNFVNKFHIELNKNQDDNAKNNPNSPIKNSDKNNKSKLAHNDVSSKADKTSNIFRDKLLGLFKNSEKE